MELLVLEDNGGHYYWTIVASDGATLAQSGTFSSYDAAEQAALRIRDGAASARFDLRGGRTRPAVPVARRDRVAEPAS